jgi:hypothetical protein
VKAMLESLAVAITSSAATSWWQSIGGRVYLNEAPGDTPLPLCVYQVASHSITPAFTSGRREVFEIEFTHFHAHSSGAAVALESAEKLDALLDDRSLTATGYDRVVLRSLSRGIAEMDDDAIRTTSRFRAIGTRT